MLRSPGPFVRSASLAALGLTSLLGLAPGCGDAPPPPSNLRDARVAAGAAPLQGAESCQVCHRQIAADFAEHGMSQSLGLLDHRPVGELTNAGEGSSYAFLGEGDTVGMVATRPDGGLRFSGVVGRYGAGVFDTAYIGTELTPEGAPTGRLAFLPVEQVEGHGPALAPFEATHPGTGFDQPFSTECLGCHTTQDVAELPGAATDPESGRVWPAGAFGTDAFGHLKPLGCSACHGEAAAHAGLMQESLDSGQPYAELGLQRLAELSGARQRDVCARCHLQGEGHLELATVQRGGPQAEDFLLRRPVLVPSDPGGDFRFVSQVQRLALSACLQGAPELSCTSCHDPHRSVARQGVAAFDARCQGCHEEQGCARPASLGVREVSGRAARSETGCVDCHVRRSQPFDLPHVQTADHFVRRRIPLPDAPPMRAWEAPSGPLSVFDDGRFAELLASAAGDRWVDGLRAMGLQRMGRHDEAAERYADFATPGTPAATSAPSPGPTPTDARLPPLQRAADFHHVRGLVLESGGDADGARAAYTDALDVDPGHPAARLNRGNLRLEAGQLEGALADADELVRRYPRAEKPWNLRARVAAAGGELDAAAEALTRSATLWPSDAGVWHELGRVFLRLDRLDEARGALRRARALEPSRQGLAADLATAGG